MSGNNHGILLIAAAPLGAGKMLLRRAMLERHPEIRLSVSYTTRPRFSHEINGQDYIFVETKEFHKKVAAGDFLEWAEINGHAYGTPKKPLLDDLAAGLDVICTIDVKGARVLKKAVPRSLTVFVCPTNWNSLTQRLRERDPGSAQDMEPLLKKARKELKSAGAFDFQLVSDRLLETADRLTAILETEHWRTKGATGRAGRRAPLPL